MKRLPIPAFLLLAGLKIGCAAAVQGTPPAVPGMISIPETEECRYLAVGEGAVWTAVKAVGWHTSLARIDPQTNQVVARIPLPRGIVTDIAVGEDAVWVAAGDRPPTVYKIDPRINRVVADLSVGPSPFFSPRRTARIAAGEGAVWVMIDAYGDIFRIDPQTSQVVATIPVGGRVGPGEGGVAVGEGAVWFHHDSGVSRFDPLTNRVVAKIPVGKRPPLLGGKSIAAGRGAVWVATFLPGAIHRIDPQTNQVVASISVESLALGGVPAMVAGEGAILAGFMGFRTGDWIAEIDPKTNVIARKIPFGTGGRDRDYSLAVGEGAVWTCRFGQVWRFPLASL